MIETIQLLLEEAFRQGSFLPFFLMFGGGVLASLTPCTYPVLPLTVGYIGNQAAGDRLRAFLLSLSMVTGLAAVYALLGSAVAALGGTFGSLMGNGWVLFTIAAYFLAMGLYLLDVFHFPIPHFLYALQAKPGSRKGLLGAFVVGGVSGLIVGPCTGPILAVALGTIALTLKNVQGIDYALQILKGGVLLFLFGFGQGALILLAGTFTGFLSRLPKSGGWMVAVKKGSALLIIATASFMFVFVGQNTDFPSLTQFLAGTSETSAVSKLGSGSEATPKPSAVEQRSTGPAPDFTLPTLSGVDLTLSRLKGNRGVVLVFFATWCVNCMKEVPEIKQFADAARQDYIVVIGINFKQSEEIVKRFKDSESINYGLVLDKEGNVTTGLYGISGIPHVVGIDGNGDIVYRGSHLPADKAGFIAKLKKGL